VSPTAAQDKAINDLTRTLTDFSAAVQVRGQLSYRVGGTPEDRTQRTRTRTPA
jgi:hypothetical protein